MNSVCGVNSMGRLIMKTDITGQLVGIFNTLNTQINTTVFNVHFRLTFMLPEGSNEQKNNLFRKGGAEGGRTREADVGRPQSTKINEVV